MSSRIFVSIACYRDPESQHTVRDLFVKAAHPENISVGICWQFDARADADCFVVPPPFPSQVKRIDTDAAQSHGCGWARNQAGALMQDEDYYLQIDAHMRFVQGWDVAMVEAWRSCNDDRAILSTSVPGYQPPNLLEKVDADKRRLTTVHVLGAPDDPQLVHLGHITWNRRQLPAGPMRGAFIVGNFVFMPAQAARELPYDPYIYFRGQEPAFSARLWTHGWNIYQPDAELIYHYWLYQSRAAGTSEDYKKNNERARLSRQRVEHLLMGKPAPSEALRDIGNYSIGNKRSLESFWQFAGVDLPARRIHTFANKGRWDGWNPAS